MAAFFANLRNTVLAGFVLAMRGKLHVPPSREQILLVPHALAMAKEDELIGSAVSHEANLEHPIEGMNHLTAFCDTEHSFLRELPGSRKCETT